MQKAMCQRGWHPGMAIAMCNHCLHPSRWLPIFTTYAFESLLAGCGLTGMHTCLCMCWLTPSWRRCTNGDPPPKHTHALQVIVQQRSGGLIWESGDANRLVAVPEDAPVGTMLHADCTFDCIALMPVPELQPVTLDVLESLEAKVQEDAAAAEAARAAEEEQQHAVQAAAAVAKALATMGEAC